MDRLRNRKQGPTEPVLHYYYDMLDMCRSVNVDMPEKEIIDHLLAGLHPTLVKKIVPLKLATCGELLEIAKLFIRAEEMTTPTGVSAAGAHPRRKSGARKAAQPHRKEHMSNCSRNGSDREPTRQNEPWISTANWSRTNPSWPYRQERR